MLTDEQRQDAADATLKAERTREVRPQPWKTWPDITLEDAYEVQRRWADARLAQRTRIVGQERPDQPRHAAGVEMASTSEPE